MAGVRRNTFGSTSRARGRRLRQHWRWIPLPVRLRLAQIRGRLMHRRTAIRTATALVATVVLVAVLANPTPVESEVNEVSIPDDHRVLSLPIDERVPLLEPGDTIDLYLAAIGLAGSADGVRVLEEPGVVTTVGESAFSVAVPVGNVAAVAAALREDGVLVVRR